MKTSDFRRQVGLYSALFGLLLCASCGGGPPEMGSGTTERPGEQLTAFSEQITSPIQNFEVKAGETYSLPITVKNTGPQAWRNGQGPMTVDAGYRWVDSAGKLLEIEGNRAALKRPILHPGESDTMNLMVTAPQKPGLYTLRVSMVQEGIAWFSAHGAEPLNLQVKVT